VCSPAAFVVWESRYHNTIQVPQILPAKSRKIRFCDPPEIVYKTVSFAGLGNLKKQIENADAVFVAPQAQSLPLPLGASARQINWRYVAAVGTHHLLALLAFVPWFYSKTGVVLLIVGIYVYGAFGMNLCYHRLLTHRSFKCPLWLEHALAVLAVWCVEDTPARWVATHRLHHHRSDERPDPHSPLVNLFWSHMGWLFVDNTDLGRNVAYDRYARDIIRDRFYRWI
jgi:hypothetical protein